MIIMTSWGDHLSFHDDITVIWYSGDCVFVLVLNPLIIIVGVMMARKNWMTVYNMMATEIIQHRSASCIIPVVTDTNFIQL